MSFLAPWFIVAGLAAVALPVLFHLFRRTPRGRMPFSTLMFLTPSPPRLTSRNRLENWPLLLLRAIVLTLLAIAFGRPFLRQLLEQQSDAPVGKRIVLLIDTSASMRRGDLWSRAIQAAEQVLDRTGPHDELALSAFDDKPQPLVTLETWRAAPVGERAALARAALAELSPSWSATRLDQALVAAVETLEAADQDKASKNIEREKRIVLVSDLQAGSRVAGLQSIEWPKRVPVELITVAAKTVNAGVHPLETTDDNARANTASHKLRVLVTNSAGSSRESFELAWSGDTTNPPVQVYVPPGQTRVTTTPPFPAGDVAQLKLSGDDEMFDNALWFVPPTREQVRVLHLSTEKSDDPQSLRYFLERALGSPAAGRIVTVDTIDPHAENVRAPTERDLDNVPLVVLGVDRELPEPWRESLGAWLERGGVLLAVVSSSNATAWRSFLPAELADPPNITVADPDKTREYSLLSEIDLRHPLFEPLNDPRFSDFTKIRFWRHRRIALNDTAQKSLRVLAKFDSGEPAWLEAPRGAGRLMLLAAGWQPRESQLGVSSKFVPLMATLVDLGWRRPPPTASYEAGQVVDLSRLGESEPESRLPKSSRLRKSDSASPWKIKTPTGEQLTIPADAPQFQPAAGPGVYEVTSSAGLQRLAINVPADESKTEPLGPEALESLGIRLWKPDTEPTPITAAEKQLLQIREIESRQQLWRWCLVLAIVAVIGETWYAGKVARAEGEGRRAEV